MPITSPKRSSIHGTKVFMAIGALDGDPHSFMHDLESFFWMLFWICIHYTGPGKELQDVSDFKDWNYGSTGKVAQMKDGIISPWRFERQLEQYITDYCQPLIPIITELWQKVFPHEQRWQYEDKTLYAQMKAALEKARDHLVAEEAV